MVEASRADLAASSFDAYPPRVTAPVQSETREPARALPGEELPRVRRRWAAAVVLGAVAALGLLAGQVWVFHALSWVHRAPLSNPEWGINYSCNYAEYLLLEDPTRGMGWAPDDRPGRVQWCAETFARLLDLTGAKRARLSVEWSQVEPQEGSYDFALVDALLATAEAKGVRVFLGVGIKAQRHPEYYIPAWALAEGTPQPGAVITNDPRLRARALRMVEAVAGHVSGSPAIEAWGADNEPYVPSSRADNWTLGRDFVQAEIEILRRLDPLQRPVVVNQAQHTLWQGYPPQRRSILEDADVLAISFYPQRNYSILGLDFVAPIPELAPVHPNYAAHATQAREAGRQYWITELQGEPWADSDIHLVSPANPSPNLSPEKFEDNVEYARRTGASRVYLWGAEWWLFQQERYGDGRWLEMARRLLAGQ